MIAQDHWRRLRFRFHIAIKKSYASHEHMIELKKKMQATIDAMTPPEVSFAEPEKNNIPTQDQIVTITVVDQKIALKIKRPVSHIERRFLKSHRFTLDDEQDVWWTELVDDEMENEVREFFEPKQSAIIESGEQTMNPVFELEQKLSGKENANEIFMEASAYAALQKVREMLHAAESSDRQRAQETVLGYALGKPMERITSLNVQVANMGNEEIVDKIHEILGRIGDKIGIESAARKSAILLDEPRRDPSDQPIEGIQTKPRFSGKVFRE